MKKAADINIVINPNDWDWIVVYPDNIEYLFKAKPHANNHILISTTARETKENMIKIIGNRLVTDIDFTATENG